MEINNIPLYPIEHYEMAITMNALILAVIASAEQNSPTH